jgi:cysteate synthase
VQDGKVEKDATIMLNITGAGEQAFKSSHDVFELKPAKLFSLKASAEEVIEAVEEMFKEYINE